MQLGTSNPQNTIAKDEITNRVSSLFKYIQELNKLKQKTILNVKDYKWKLWCAELPDDFPNVKLNYQDRMADDRLPDDNEWDNVLLTVHKEDFKPCPSPPQDLRSWLKAGWNDYRNTVAHDEEKRIIIDDLSADNAVEKVVKFAEDPDRVHNYQVWLEKRARWVDNQKRIARNSKIFNQLYSEYYALKRDSETEEIILANGVFCDATNKDICHPILTRRVKLDFDAENNTVFIRDTESEPELYTDMLKDISGINMQVLNNLQKELLTNDYHPLDRNDTPRFLNKLIRQLSADSIYADDGRPNDWEQNNRFLLYNAPCFIVRKRQSGTVRAIERINEAINSKQVAIPKTLVDLVGGSKVEAIPADREYSVEEQLAMVGGESLDILLSKEANGEQLEIAQRIEDYNAVLVQGPPGTGKTHTIANLLGHFIAHGKSVLVTSHTTKALKVLKDKITPGLQNLCVSMLDDSNKDMEKAIDGITDFISKNTLAGIKKEMVELSRERKTVIGKLADIRKKIFMSLHKECESITYQGDSYSSIEAAKYVAENEERLDFIPGTIKARDVLPLTYEELVELYQSNESITASEESELDYGLPSPIELLDINGFEKLCESLKAEVDYLAVVNQKSTLSTALSVDKKNISFSIFNNEFSIPLPEKKYVDELVAYCCHYNGITAWQKTVVIDGMAGGGYRNRWQSLIKQIEVAKKLGSELADKGLGKEIVIPDGAPVESLLSPLQTVKEFLANGGLPWMFSWRYKECAKVLESFAKAGEKITTVEDCELAILQVKLQCARNECNKAWHTLLESFGVPAFMSLGNDPERAADNYVQSITLFLDWANNEYPVFKKLLQNVGFVDDKVCGITDFDTAQSAMEKRLEAIGKIIPLCCDVCVHSLVLVEKYNRFEQLKQIITEGKRANSEILQELYKAVMQKDCKMYAAGMGKLEDIYDKYAMRDKRYNYLQRLAHCTPEWAESIRRREGIHGEAIVPHDILEAWKWRQFSMLLDEIAAMPLAQYQSECKKLSKEYRKLTAEYAEKSGWYNLLKRTSVDMQQSLQGWKLAVRQIGKGTGKQAPMFKAVARSMMTKCQQAVPAWIMPINKAMESLNPTENKFDIVIIDEASQSDIASLGIFFMGKKLIIVGDDKQVSPMGVGINVTQMNNVKQATLSKAIPNYAIYDGQTSVYDIAMTTYHPLMLKEHFRCVPEIIGYSNWLSYAGKILPLRAASDSSLLPALVNYRVDDGQRDSQKKINVQEAKTVVALMKTCMLQPEYKGKTFGVISMVGEEQALLIENLISQDNDITPREIEERQILCGNSANFQGDERDVVFLSMVDSNGADDKLLAMQGFGFQDATRKRYNVAVSRARDQLWVVHSLDVSKLKAGDIRRGLLEYAANPYEVERQRKNVTVLADSEFEVQVVMKLKARGYHIVQQWKVGAYSIDMVAVYGDKKIAIECDGNKYHSSPDQVRHDMERQTILERIGWTFIRIRGSEYFRQPEATIERVVAELEDLGIKPEQADEVKIAADRNTELLTRIKQKVALSLQKQGKQESDKANALQEVLERESEKSTVQSVKRGSKGEKKTPKVNKTPVKPKKKTQQIPLFNYANVGRENSQDNLPKNLRQAADLLRANHFEIIDKSQSDKVIWLLAEKDVELSVKNLLGDAFTVNWDKRGIRQTANRPYFIVRSIDYAKREK